jgi:hypothetical protein
VKYKQARTVSANLPSARPEAGADPRIVPACDSLAIDDARAGAQAPESLDDQREAHQPQSVGLNFQNMDVNRHRSVARLLFLKRGLRNGFELSHQMAGDAKVRWIDA